MLTLASKSNNSFKKKAVKGIYTTKNISHVFIFAVCQTMWHCELQLYQKNITTSALHSRP